MVPHSERSAFSKLRTTTAAAPTRGGRPWAGRRSRMRSRRPIHPRVPGGPYQRPSRTRTFVGWCRAARWKLRSATNGRASASRRPGCPPAAAASDVVTATAGTRRCGWRPHRRPTAPDLRRSDGAELVAFEFAFRRQPAMAVSRPPSTAPFASLGSESTSTSRPRRPSHRMSRRRHRRRSRRRRP